MDEEERRNLISEYRFTYWRGGGEERCFTVERGRRQLADSWGVFDGIETWTGTHWSLDLRGPTAYCWTEEEALTIASLLARQKNAEVVEMMERLHPGEIKGGPHDFAAKEGRKPTE